MGSDWIDVSSVKPRIAYTATAGQTTFTIPFVFFENTDLQVYQNGTLLILGTHYAVVGAEAETGGTATLVTGAALGDQILITRRLPIEQTTHIPPSGPLDIAAINIQISKLVAISQQLDDDQQRSLHFPDNDANTSGELASVSSRKNKLIGFGSSGEVIYPLGPSFVGTTANGVAQVDSRATAQVASFDVSVNVIVTGGYAGVGDGGGAAYKRGAGAGSFTDGGSVTWSLDLSNGLVNVMPFGALGLGGDYTTAIQAALTAAKGKRLHFPAGTYGVTSTLNGTDGNIRITGEGKGRSIIQVLGASALDPLLQFTDASDVDIEGVCLLGNSVTVGVGAILFGVTAGSDVKGRYTIYNCCFKNFRAHYWLRCLTNVTSTSHTRSIRYVRIIDCDWFSQSGNAPDFTNVGIPANMLDFNGSIDNNASVVDDVIVSGNFADCGQIKCFAGAWAGARNVLITNNYILNAGAAGVNDHGCYGIVVYNSHPTADVSFSPQDVTVSDNSIIAARSMGVYGATATRLIVTRNKISGVQDTTAASLPYAAISLGQCEDSKVRDNDLVDNYVAIQLIPTPTSITCEATGNRIRSSVASAKGVISTVLGSFINKVKIDDNTIILPDAGAVGISCTSGGVGAEFDTLDIARNRIAAGDTGIFCANNSGGGIRGNQVSIVDNEVGGSFDNVGIAVEDAVARTFITGNVVNMAQAGSAAFGVRFGAAVNLNIDGLKIANRSTGSVLAFSAPGANGTMRNVNLVAVARANLPANGSGHMGFQMPVVTPTGVGAFIQNLSTTYYTAQGSSPQYTVDGWSSDGSTSWLPKRCLTGT